MLTRCALALPAWPGTFPPGRDEPVSFWTPPLAATAYSGVPDLAAGGERLGRPFGRPTAWRRRPLISRSTDWMPDWA